MGKIGVAKLLPPTKGKIMCTIHHSTAVVAPVMVYASKHIKKRTSKSLPFKHFLPDFPADKTKPVNY